MKQCRMFEVSDQEPSTKSMDGLICVYIYIYMHLRSLFTFYSVTVLVVASFLLISEILFMMYRSPPLKVKRLFLLRVRTEVVVAKR